MIISSPITRWTLLATALTFSVFGQDAPSAAKTPLDHVIGTISAVDQQAQTVTIQEDKTNTPHVIQLTTTKTLLKVEPSAKDLKSAVRITAGDLEVGDRVDVRGTRQADAPTTLAAKSVILMSGRALAATHEQQAAAWAKATSARVTAVDAASGNITADIRLAGENQSVTVKTSPKTEFTRYSPETGKPAPSQISQIQTGDQLKVVGEKTDGSISADRVYSGAFRTISMTVTSLGADGKTITGKDLTTKKEVVVDVNSGASIHKLPPMMAMMLARRLNPGASMNPAGGPPTGGATGTPGGQVRQGANGQGANGQGGMPAGGPPTGANGAAYPGSPGAGSPGAGSPGAGGPAGAGRGGDMSQMIQHTPTITLADLKAGDALVISGVATGSDNSHLMATSVIAGVEPILQSAPAQRAGGSRGGGVGSDWGLGEMAAPQ